MKGNFAAMFRASRAAGTAAVLLGLLLIPRAAPAQERPESGEPQRNNYASPSFGVSFYNMRLERGDLKDVTSSMMEEEKYYQPAVDIRVFRGINITKRGGFYAGVEAGAEIFTPDERTYIDNVSVTDPESPNPPIWGYPQQPVTFNTSFYGGDVFLMMKYGYRYDFGHNAVGLSLGLQIGTGASLFSGGYDVWVGDKDNPDAEGGKKVGETTLSLAADLSLEVALRFGKNSRFFVAGGMIMTPIEIGSWGSDQVPQTSIMNDGVANTQSEYLSYALNNYEVRAEGMGLSLRAGFTLNFD